MSASFCAGQVQRARRQCLALGQIDLMVAAQVAVAGVSQTRLISTGDLPHLSAVCRPRLMLPRLRRDRLDPLHQSVVSEEKISRPALSITALTSTWVGSCCGHHDEPRSISLTDRIAAAEGQNRKRSSSKRVPRTRSAASAVAVATSAAEGHVSRRSGSRSHRASVIHDDALGLFSVRRLAELTSLLLGRVFLSITTNVVGIGADAA